MKSKFCIFDQKNSDNSKTPLSIPDFFCVCVTSNEKNVWVPKFLEKKTKNFFLYNRGGFSKNWKKIYAINGLKCGRQTHYGKLEGFRNIMTNF